MYMNNKFYISLAALAFCMIGTNVSQAGELQNGSFEDINFPSDFDEQGLVEQTDVSAWSVTPSSGATGPTSLPTVSTFEVWSSGYLSVYAQDGNTFIEMNSNRSGTVYQAISNNTKGGIFALKFYHRDREDDDDPQLDSEMRLVVRGLGDDGVHDVTYEQDILTAPQIPGYVFDNVATGDDEIIVDELYVNGDYTKWTENSVAFVNASGNDIQLEFSAVTLGSYGNFLDNISLYEIASYGSIADGLTNTALIQSKMMRRVIENNCDKFGLNGVCIGVSLGKQWTDTDSSFIGDITLAKQLNEQMSLGGWLSIAGDIDTAVGYQLHQNKSIGANFVYDANNGRELQVKASVGFGGGDLSYSRENGEGSGSGDAYNWMFDVNIGYGFDVSSDVTFRPYVALNHNKFSREQYTEDTFAFSDTRLSLSQFKVDTTDVSLGAKFDGQLHGGVVFEAGYQMTKNIGFDGNSILVSCDICGLVPEWQVSKPKDQIAHTVYGELGFQLEDNSLITVNARHQTQMFDESYVTSAQVGYTKPF